MGVGQSTTPRSSHAPKCRWCDATLTLFDRKEGVCERCYRLLSAAGISDEEIFFSHVPADEPFPLEAIHDNFEKRA